MCINLNFFHCNSSFFLFFIIFFQYKNRNNEGEICSFYFFLRISTNF
ncbi:hypothetical protein BMB171_C3650 [Bacillus thuringiensis BMB171]|nr:hypothetical protein BMB171_C3650 [Bacillus thuringiensis BMB171]